MYIEKPVLAMEFVRGRRTVFTVRAHGCEQLHALKYKKVRDMAKRFRDSLLL